MNRGETDYFLGSYTLNLIGTLMLAGGIAVLAVLHPEWPAVALDAVGAIAIVGFALGFYPFSRLLWLAFDLSFRRARPSDFGGD